MQAESRLRLQLHALGNQASKTAMVSVEKGEMEEEEERGEGEKEWKEERVDGGEEEKRVQDGREEELVKEECGGEEEKMAEEKEEGNGGEEGEESTCEGGMKEETKESKKMEDKRIEREGVETEEGEWEEAGDKLVEGAVRKEKAWVLLEDPSQLKQEEHSATLSAVSVDLSASTESGITALIDEAMNDCDPKPASATDAESCGQRTSSDIPTSSDIAQQPDSHDDGNSNEPANSGDSKYVTSVTETSIASEEESEQINVSGDLRSESNSLVPHAPSDVGELSLVGGSQELNPIEAVADFESIAPLQQCSDDKLMSDSPCHIVQSQVAHVLDDTASESAESNYPISAPLQSSIAIPPRVNATSSTDAWLPSTIEQSIQKQLAQVCFSPRSYTDFKDHLEHIPEMILPWESLRRHSKCSCGISFSFTARKVYILDCQHNKHDHAWPH